MGKNEKTLLKIALEILGLLIDRANTGDDITDKELDKGLEKAKDAIDKFKQ